MGDFSGNPTSPLKPLRDREFVSIDRDNFDQIMQRMTPGLNLKVQNTLANDNTEMSVQLKFESMADFDPANVARQVPALKKLLETREQLKSLIAKAERSDELEGVLEKILANAEEIKKASTQLGADGPTK
jgi:type VI secretion system protein ImpB